MRSQNQSNSKNIKRWTRVTNLLINQKFKKFNIIIQNFCIFEIVFDIFNILKYTKNNQNRQSFSKFRNTIAKMQKSTYVFLWIFQNFKNFANTHSINIVTNNFLNIVAISNFVISIMTTCHSSSSSINSSFTQICL